jgi:hypothetical protein
LFTSLFEGIEGEMRIDNIFDRMKFGDETCDVDESDLDFCSSHLFEIEESKLNEMSFEFISSMISRESLKLVSEESLFDFLRKRICSDHRYWNLFEYVRFEYLSVDSMRLFVEMIGESNEFLTTAIFESLCRRLVLSVSPTNPNDRIISQSIKCEFREGSPLDGIISYLTKKHGCHVLDGNIVSITASSVVNRKSYPLRNIADFENQTFFATTNDANSWIHYDFKNIRIKPTHYSIRSARDGNHNHLRCWTLEGSVDGKSWMELDRREKDKTLNGTGAVSTFAVSRSEEIQMIRLCNRGKNSSNSDQLVVNAIEFFGAIIQPQE